MNWDYENNNRKLENTSGTEEELIRLIREGEHQEQDFKFRIDSNQKIAKTLCAFANTDGGRLLIGVKDNAKVVGVDPEEEYFMIEGAATLFCKPEIKFEPKIYAYEDVLVLEIWIPPSAERPHFVKEMDGRFTAYIRQKDENFAANKVLVKFLKDKRPKSEIKNLMKFGDTEKLLFNYLGENENISVSKFSKLAKIPIYRAEKILALLLKWEVLNWQATDKGIRFSIKE